MPQGKSYKELRKQVFIYGGWLLFAILLIAGGYYLENKFHFQLGSHIVTEIGIAVLVAIILALTIEHQSRKSEEKRAAADREREEARRAAERSAIKKDVFDHVLGYRLPDGTFEEVDTQILRASFIRKDCTVFYQLTPMESMSTHQQYMKLKAKLTYKIVNLTPEKLPYRFITSIEKAPVQELDSHVKFTSVNVKGCETALELNEEELKTANKTTRPNHIVIERPINILPDGYASATIKFEAVRALEGGTSFILHHLQTVGFDLKVEATSGVEVVADAYFREKLKEGDEHLPHIGSYHWVMRSPILPYQGIYVTWKSKAADIAEQPGNAASE